MYLLNNIKFNPDIQRTIGDVQYPHGWFRDPLERAKIGVTEVPDPIVPDDRLFTSVENPDGSYTATPRTATDLAAKLETEKANFVYQIDADTDSIIRAVIGERASEYELAEKEATSYKAAGYPATPVPGSVSSWATAKGWTNTAAADNILATATGWRTAQATIRADRLLRKQHAVDAVDVTALDGVKASWAAFLVTIKGQLGL
jgi:hypothetical protein